MAIKSWEIVPLMKAASRKAAEAREAGDMQEFEYWKGTLERLGRVHSGMGTLEDDLEIERAKAKFAPLAMLGKIGGGVGMIGIAALGALALVMLKK